MYYLIRMTERRACSNGYLCPYNENKKNPHKDGFELMVISLYVVISITEY